MAGRHHAIFGLGNKRAYPERYQKVGRCLEAQLQQLGSTPLLPLGEGDDSADIEGDFEAWEAAILQRLKTWLSEQADGMEGQPKSPSTSANHRDKPEDTSRYTDTISVPITIATQAWTPFDALKQQVVHCDLQVDCASLRLEEKHSLRASWSPRECWHFSLGPSDTDSHLPTFTAGDHVGIYAANSPETVERALDLFHLSEHPHQWGDDLNATDMATILAPLQAQRRGGPFFWPQNLIPDPLTFFTWWCDIVGPPTAALRRALRDAGAPSHSTALHALAELPFPTCLSLASRLQPRLYSISSAPHTQRLDMTVARVDTDLGEGVHAGVSSTYLASLSVGDVLAAYTRASSMRFPSDSSRPMVLIAAGTGIAPLRSLWQERQRRLSEHSSSDSSPPLGECIVYFGCNAANEDYYYADEMQQCLQEGSLSEVIPVFTYGTETGSASQKLTFVQDIIAQQGQRLYHIVHEKNGILYVCGAANGMCSGVRKALTSIWMDYGKLSAEEAELELIRLESQGQYQEDCF